MDGVQVNGGPILGTKRVYYSGTDQLQVGYALCYDHAATLESSTVQSTARGRQVVKPATANLMFFAGIVAQAPPGVGPCWVDIWTPAGSKGEYLQAYTLANMTLGVTVLGPANGAYSLAAVPIDPTSAATLDASGQKQVAVAWETVDTSGGAANKQVRFL